MEMVEEKEILSLLDKNRVLLEELSIACSCHLRVEAHQVMSHIAVRYGAESKFSVARGGDCNAGVGFNEKITETVLYE